MTKTFLSAIALAAVLGPLGAGAAQFGSEIEQNDQRVEVENALGLAIDGSTAVVGASVACGLKARTNRQSVKAKNVLGLAIGDSTAFVAANVAGDGRCFR